MTTKKWELGGRSCSNRHIWRGRKGLEEGPAPRLR